MVRKIFVIAGISFIQFQSCAALGSCPSQPVPPSDFDVRKMVFGIPLGYPVTFPKCRYGSNDLVELNETQCFDYYVKDLPDDGCAPPANTDENMVLIRFTREELPEWVGQRNIHLTIIDGNVERIEIRTAGYAYQQQVMTELGKKYGAPSTKSISIHGNAEGREYESKDATWKLPRYSVTFQGIVHRRTLGLIVVTSEKMLSKLRDDASKLLDRQKKF